MSSDSVFSRVQERLSLDIRGDRGWFIITRVHVEAYWIKGVADYLFKKGGAASMVLTDLDYVNIAKITGVSSHNPGQQLRRHHFLVMDKPLGLICRTKGSSWKEISLTPFGRKVASTGYFAPILDRALKKIGFAQSEAIPPGRSEAYSQFDVLVFDAVSRVLSSCGGHISRDEFDFFVSRIRSDSEVSWAIEGVHDYRETMNSFAAAADRKDLLERLNALVRAGLSAKEYQNWRDVGLHTFSLFGIGEKMVRDGQELWLTSEWVASNRSAVVAVADDVEEGMSEHGEAGRVEKKTVARRPLKIPAPPQDDELSSPPMTPPSLNSGVEAENLIAKILTSQGWRVVFYSNKRGFGFDLWASKGGVAMVIEVKSSIDLVGQINLTPNEYEAALHHKANFVLAVVEYAHTPEARVWFVADPANNVEIREGQALSYKIARESWAGSALKLL